MGEATLITNDEVRRIEAALDKLLTEIQRLDDLRREQTKPNIGPLSLSHIGDINTPRPNRQQCETTALLGDHTVRVACKTAIRRLGEYLHILGLSKDERLDIAERVANMPAGQVFQGRMSVIDSAWDGIGGWWS